MNLKKLVQTTFTLYSNVLKQVLIFCGFGAIQNVRHSQSGIFDHATNYAKKVTNYGMVETKFFCTFGCLCKPCYVKRGREDQKSLL